MNAYDTILNSVILTSGGTGLVVMILLFIRQLISNTTKNTTKNSAEIDILTMWKIERDALKKLTEELQGERLELMIKLSNLQIQLQSVHDQLNTLIQDKKDLTEQVRLKDKICETCVNVRAR